MLKNNFSLFQKKVESFVSKYLVGELYITSCLITSDVNLSPEETEIIKNSVNKRKFEFSAARYCAHKCLQMSGNDCRSILKGKFGGPIWPIGVTGSITHHDGIAIAMTVPYKNARVGIDLINLDDDFSAQHLVISDIERGNHCHLDIDKTSLIIFSLKEAVIKILSPLMGEYLDFLDIEIRIKTKSIEVKYLGELLDIKGFYMIEEKHVFTLAYQPLI